MKYKLFLYVALGSAITVLRVPAVAQFEVAPDHFSDSAQDQSAAATAPAPELKAKIAATAAELEGYQARLSRQANAVENARELAAGAGGMGESAYLFIDEYLRQCRELEQLRHDLAPRIAQSQAALDALNQLASIGSATSVVAVSAPQRRKAIAGTSAKAKPATAKRKPQSSVLSASARVSR